MTTVKSKLYVIDISNFIHRAFHVHQHLATSKGFPSGAIYGTLMMMCKFIADNQPSYVAVCYDAQDGRSIRKDIYPQYKANRPQVNAVSTQEIVVRKVISLLGMFGVVAPGYEADDLIASITNKFKDQVDVVILTGDKDMIQLVDKNVSVYDSMKNAHYDEKTAMEKFGVRANQISDYLALVGDKVDNIPGAMGIGPKAAQQLLAKYNCTDDILSDIHNTPEKYREKLEKSKDLIVMSKKLTVLQNVELPGVSLETLEFNPQYSDELNFILTRLEFGETTKNKVREAIRLYER